MQTTAVPVRQDLTRAIVLGAVLWGVYAVLHVAVTGIVLDETVEPAQIIVDAVRYPAGHPHDVFYRGAYSLSNYSAAAIYYLSRNPAVVSFVRNWLVLFVTVFSVYVLTLALTRRRLWAFVAAALVLLEAFRRFGGVYPLPIFPTYYSNGPLGLMFGVLAIALWLAGLRRTSSFLLGLLPAIHVALAATVYVWACIEVALEARRHGLAQLRRLVVPAAGGMLLSLALAVFIQTTAGSPDVDTSPYQSAGDPSIVREQFRLLTDVHRGPYSFLQLGYLDNLAAFAALAVIALLLTRPDDRPAVASVIIFGSTAWAYVIAARTFEATAGWLPSAVLMSMPARFSNYSAVLLVPLTVFVLAAWLVEARIEARRSLAILVATALLVTALFSSRFVAGASSPILGTKVLIFLWGLIFGSVVGSGHGRLRLVAALAIATLAAVFVAQRSMTGALSYFLGAASVGFLGSLQPARPSSGFERVLRAGHRWAPSLLVVAVGVAALSKVVGVTAEPREPQFVRWDMVSRDNRAIRDWISRNAGPDELVLTTIVPRSALQPKLDRPILFELETLYLMAYMPRVARVVGTMAKDLYGVDYANPSAMRDRCPGHGLGIYCSVWADAWKRRSRQEWRELSSKYGFRLLVAPATLTLDLDAALAGSQWTVYMITN